MAYLPLMVYVSTNKLKDFKVFDLHPIGMALCFAIQSIGISQLVNKKTAAFQNFPAKVKRHVMAIVFSSTSLLIGSGAVIYSKYAKGYGHLETIHAIVGGVSVALVLSQHMFGALAFLGGFKQTFASIYGKIFGLNADTASWLVGRIHGIFGAVASSGMFASLYLAFQKEFFINVNQQMNAVVLTHVNLILKRFNQKAIKLPPLTVWYAGLALIALIYVGNLIQVSAASISSRKAEPVGKKTK